LRVDISALLATWLCRMNDGNRGIYLGYLTIPKGAVQIPHAAIPLFWMKGAGCGMDSMAGSRQAHKVAHWRCVIRAEGDDGLRDALKLV
jgi:hypothetical protein